MKAGNNNNRLVIEPDPEPCGGNQFAKVASQNTIKKQTLIDLKPKLTIKIFNNFGNLVYIGAQISNNFDVSSLKKGFYVVKYQTTKGNMITKKLMVE